MSYVSTNENVRHGREIFSFNDCQLWYHLKCCCLPLKIVIKERIVYLTTYSQRWLLPSEKEETG